MKLYEVRYKKVNSIFWKNLRKVIGDGFVENQVDVNNKIVSTKDIRWFILEDETRIEIPCQNIIFKFSNNRFYAIKDRMEQDSGLDMKINKR
jgi:hypothetical protein